MTTPTEHVDLNLNLDVVEERKFKPYTFSIGGRVFTFTDPTVLDWQVVEQLSTLEAMAEHCMSAEDRKAFYATPLASYKLNLLFDDVQKHFELGEYAKRRRY